MIKIENQWGIRNMNENNNLIDEKHELTAGAMLRNARTTGRRKREIPTIAKQLCIREEFLQALEDGDYTVIPEVVYILGFARNYAMELGLDADIIVSKIKHELGLVPDTTPITGTDGERTASRRFSLRNAMNFHWFQSAYGFVRRNWIWFAGAFAAIVIIALVVWGVTHISNNSPAPTNDPTPVVTENKPIEPAFRKPVRERFETKNRNTANVVIQAISESWVKIEDARGSTVFSRVLVAGDVLYVPKGDKFKGTFGNAGGVDIWVDGKLAPRVGPDHTRKNGVSLAPDALLKATTAAEKSEKTEKSDKNAKSDKSADTATNATEKQSGNQ